MSYKRQELFSHREHLGSSVFGVVCVAHTFSLVFCVVCFALFVFVLCFEYPMLPVSLDCPVSIAPSVSLKFI